MFNEFIFVAGPAVLLVEAFDDEPGPEAECGGAGVFRGMAVQAGERGADALEEALVRPLRVLPLLLQR